MDENTLAQEKTLEKITTLYRMFDADGKLLYVGITGRLLKRFAWHRKEKSWWADVADIKLTHFPNWEDAYRAEAEAIAAEDPVYNIQRKIRTVPAQREGPVPEPADVWPPAGWRQVPGGLLVSEPCMIFGRLGQYVIDLDL